MAIGLRERSATSQSVACRGTRARSLVGGGEHRSLISLLRLETNECRVVTFDYKNSSNEN